VDVRFTDLPQIEGPTGRFMLTQVAAVAELEAGFIGERTKAALARSTKKLGGRRRRVLRVSSTGKKTTGHTSPSALRRVQWAQPSASVKRRNEPGI